MGRVERNRVSGRHQRRRLPGGNRKRFALIFFFALGVRLLVAWRAGLFQNFQRDEMVRIALSVLRLHEYGNPYR
jgi:hypothetical protein